MAVSVRPVNLAVDQRPSVISDLVGERTVRDLVEERAARYPDKTWLVCEDTSGDRVEYTYAQFLDAVKRAASGFTSIGVGKGDTVVVHLANCPEFVISWFGLAWIGGVMVPSNIANTSPEMAHVLGHSEAVAVVTSPEYLAMFQGLRGDAPAVKSLVLTGGSEPGAVSFAELTAAGDEPPRPRLRSDDLIEMIFTSGTTARPKGVLLTHANQLHAGEREARSIGVVDTDRCLTALPAFHVNAQSTTILSALTAGATCILLAEYRASRFWDQIRAHGATVTSLVAMQVRTLLAQPPSPEDVRHSVRRNFYAINVTDGEKEEFERRFGIELLNGYGLSEAMTVVTIAPLFGDRRWPSIGLPTADRRLRIVKDDGADAGPEEVGEIVVSGVPGRTLMVGYHRDPEATSATIRNGWLYTGDYGYLDQRGYVYFVDRKKDVIKRAGENVSASEVEAVLAEHPLVAEAAVIGVPDPIRDEAVKAYVVPTTEAELTVDDVLEHCRDRLAAFKIPTIVEIRSSLPKTSVGKIEKKALRMEHPATGSEPRP